MRTNWRNLYAISTFAVTFLVPPFHSPLTHVWLWFILILLYDKFLKLLEAVGRERCNKNNRGERALVFIITLTPDDFHQSCKHVPKEGLPRLPPPACSLAPQWDTEWEQMGNKHKSSKQSTGREKHHDTIRLPVRRFSYQARSVGTRSSHLHVKSFLCWWARVARFCCVFFETCVCREAAGPWHWLTAPQHPPCSAGFCSFGPPCPGLQGTCVHWKTGNFCNEQLAPFCALQQRDMHKH